MTVDEITQVLELLSVGEPFADWGFRFLLVEGSTQASPNGPKLRNMRAIVTCSPPSPAGSVRVPVGVIEHADWHTEEQLAAGLLTIIHAFIRGKVDGAITKEVPMKTKQDGKELVVHIKAGERVVVWVDGVAPVGANPPVVEVEFNDSKKLYVQSNVKMDERGSMVLLREPLDAPVKGFPVVPEVCSECGGPHNASATHGPNQ